MRNNEVLTVEQLDEFLKGAAGAGFAGQNKKEVYGWVHSVLVSQEFLQQDKFATGQGAGRRPGILGEGDRAGECAGDPADTDVQRNGIVEGRAYQRRAFSRRYTEADIALLAETDRVHEWLSGPATRRILERELVCFGKAAYARLAKISNGHPYNLRASAGYRKLVAVYRATPIQDSRRPHPQVCLDTPAGPPEAPRSGSKPSAVPTPTPSSQKPDPEIGSVPENPPSLPARPDPSNSLPSPNGSPARYAETGPPKTAIGAPEPFRAP
jgi:hypothetical protein